MVGALTLVSFVATADAEPIPVTITSGSASVNIEGGRISLTGTDGFSLTGFLDNTAIPSAYCCVSTPPGTSTTFAASFSGTDVFSSVVTFQGETFESVGAPLSPDSASVDFVSSPFTLPPLGDTNIAITAPFTFTGTFFGSRDAGQPPLQLSLVGSGIGTYDLVAVPAGWLGFGGRSTSRRRWR